MSYRDWSITETIEKIGRNDIYLPAIQRKFVWDHEQIESLFDSIMRGYPIGTFLFWFVHGEKKNEYTFYKFLDEYHERDSQNKKAAKPELKDEIIGVLDGQQRLSSMYLALQGWYSYKKPYARWDNDDAFPKRRFYLNLFKDFSFDEEYLYEFKFLTNEESCDVNDNNLWFLVSDILTWGKDPDIDEYYESLLEDMVYSDNIKNVIRSKRRSIKNKLRILHGRIVTERLINYFQITEQDLDKILDIFVRVNSGGTVLSKSDLLFSTIVANWEEGREEIESFVKLINDKGDGFRFDTDFIMRSCLVLTDCPVLFKVNSFKKENIEIIKSNWNSIKNSIEKMVNIIVEYGFNDENLTSYNVLMPIVYHIIKGGKINTKNKNQLRKYLIHAQLKQIYGGQGDTILSRFRDQLTIKKNSNVELKNTNFSFNEMLKTKLPGERTLKIDEEDIENILELRKGPYTFMILSLLYPQLKFNQVQFHQDHIHPASLFTDSKLKKMKISEEKRDEWKYKKDRLPNLQIMEGRENERKNSTPFEDWLNGVDEEGNPNVIDKGKYINDNYIPNVNYKLSNFDKFYESRTKELRKAIRKIIL